jgi:hypothetical protein
MPPIPEKGSMMPTEHVLVIGADFLGDYFIASCTCGWEDEDGHPSESAVVDAWENHCIAASMDVDDDA